MKISALTVAVAILAACGSQPPSRRDLLDGAPVRPAPIVVEPGYAPPGTGLPEYWGQPQRQLPPEPRPTRILPETPESRRGPGIWATNFPDDGPSVELLGFLWPLPPAANGSADALREMQECADGLGKAAWASKEAPALRGLSQPTLDCIAAWALVVCARDNLITDGRWESLKSGPAPTLAHHIYEHAKLQHNRACGGRRGEGDAQEHVGWITAHWKQARGWKDAEQ